MNKKQFSHVGYYTRNLSGHRQSYLDFVQTNFGGERIQGKALFLKKDPIFFLMIEDNFILYFIVACFRALLGKKTAGLLFRPKPALQANNIKLKLKLILLKCLRKIPKVQTLSIVPVPLEPEISKIVDDWIYDFQLWDLTDEQKQVFKQLRNCIEPTIDLHEYRIVEQIKKFAAGRPIVVALGMQNKGKGTQILAENIESFIQHNYCVVVAGRFADDSKEAKMVLEKSGALIFDRFITDEEILGLYVVANAVWCFYDPSYDQASGILGRAVQLGVLPIVRPASFSERFCLAEDIQHVAVNPHEHEKFFSSLERQNSKPINDKNIQEKLKLLNEQKLNVIFASNSGI